MIISRIMPFRLPEDEVPHEPLYLDAHADVPVPLVYGMIMPVRRAEWQLPVPVRYAVDAACVLDGLGVLLYRADARVLLRDVLIDVFLLYLVCGPVWVTCDDALYDFSLRVYVELVPDVLSEHLGEVVRLVGWCLVWGRHVLPELGLLEFAYSCRSGGHFLHEGLVVVLIIMILVLLHEFASVCQVLDNVIVFVLREYDAILVDEDEVGKSEGVVPVL